MAAQACLRVVVVLLALLVAVPSALAHAQLLSSAPPENALVESAPDTIELRFNEPVSPLASKLIAADGQSQDLTSVTVGGETVIVSLPTELPMGTQVLSWRVVSTDGHPIGGSLIFSVGAVTGTTPVVEVPDRAVAMLLWGGKALLYVALLGGIGGALFLAVSAVRAPARRPVLALSVMGIPVAAATLGLQGLDALGAPLATLLEARIWSAGLSTSFGVTVIVMIVAFALAVLSLVAPRAWLQLVLAALAALAVALSLALSGHASAANPQWLTRPAVALHIAGLLFWIGALVPLWMLLRGRSEDADRALARFSKYVPLAVVALLVSGFTLATVQMDWPGPHWLSPYAVILGLKLTLLVVLFGLALWNRVRLTQPALAGDAMARYRLRRSVGLELAIVLVILGLVAGWRFTPPPRALAAVASVAVPVHAHVMTEQAMADLSLSPGKAGPTRLELWLTEPDGAPMTPQAVGITLSEPTLGIEPLKHSAVLEEGHWVVDDLTIPVAGTWLVQIDIRVSRFELRNLQTKLTIP